MREVTKEQFKELYFGLGGGDRGSGWNLDCWKKFFEKDQKPGMKYRVQEPETPRHTEMMIVTDFSKNEYRLFFMTEEAVERHFDSPEKDAP